MLPFFTNNSVGYSSENNETSSDSDSSVESEVESDLLSVSIISQFKETNQRNRNLPLPKPEVLQASDEVSNDSSNLNPAPNPTAPPAIDLCEPSRFDSKVISTSLYSPNFTLPLYPTKYHFSTIQILVNKKYCFDPFTPSNLAFRERRLWGTRVYSDDSDILMAAAHSGLLKLPSSEHHLITLGLLPPLKHYTGTFAPPNLKSRGWGLHDGNSFCILTVKELGVEEFEGLIKSRKKKTVSKAHKNKLDRSEGSSVVGNGSAAGISGELVTDSKVMMEFNGDLYFKYNFKEFLNWPPHLASVLLDLLNDFGDTEGYLEVEGMIVEAALLKSVGWFPLWRLYLQILKKQLRIVIIPNVEDNESNFSANERVYVVKYEEGMFILCDVNSKELKRTARYEEIKWDDKGVWFIDEKLNITKYIWVNLVRH
ncbi:hypothetical protein HK098_000485 [Nowakowskiella sp. JEL0407]|nr:hypothetical protein HK098_000485 [Nowakowskiella sp. JEL0407]